MKKLIKILIVVAAIALVVLLIFKGFGLGEGEGGKGGPSTEASGEQSSPSGESQGPQAEDGVITVTVREDRALMGGKEYTAADEFKAAVEALNDDEHTFELTEDNALESVYEWVMEVFEELSIPVKVETAG